MNARGPVLGLSLLCALVFCVLAVPNAFASKGTTVFTCEESGSEFSDEHCTETGGTGKWSHKAIAEGTEIKLTATNEKTANLTKGSTDAVLNFTVEKVKGNLVCSEVATTGVFKNTAGTPMTIAGSSILLIMGGCKLKGDLATEKCKASEIISTESKVTSTTPTETMTIEFKPPAGKALLTFNLEGCKNEHANGSQNVTGGFNAIPEGATLSTTEKSTETLKVAGSVATFTSKVTMRKQEILGDPIVTTTTAT